MPRRPLLVQLSITLIIAIIISFISVLMDHGRLRDYQLEKGVTIIPGSMALTLLIGLPLRLNKKINGWWTRHQLIPVAGALAGCTLMYLSNFLTMDHLYPMGDNAYEAITMTNPVPVIGGWLLTIFCLLHLYLPIPRRNLWARRAA